MPVAGRATGSDHLSASRARGRGWGVSWGLCMHSFPAPSGAATTISPRPDQVVPAVGLSIAVTQEEAPTASVGESSTTKSIKSTTAIKLLLEKWTDKTGLLWQKW